jgi:hypothetical protein
LIAGATLTGDFRTSVDLRGAPSTFVYGSGPKSFIAGPTVEVEVGKGFSLETNAIYRPLRDSSTFTGASNLLIPSGSSSSTRVTWEFPVLPKYKFSVRTVKPFLELGPSFRTPQRVNGAGLSTHGITAGAGVEARLGPMRIAPGVRFTHWAPDSSGPGQSLAIQNEAAFLVGFSF